MIVILLFLYGIHRSYIGKTFKAIAQDDLPGGQRRDNVARYRALVFCIGCFFAGLAGSFMPITWVSSLLTLSISSSASIS